MLGLDSALQVPLPGSFLEHQCDPIAFLPSEMISFKTSADSIASKKICRKALNFRQGLFCKQTCTIECIIVHGGEQPRTRIHQKDLASSSGSRPCAESPPK